MIEKKYKYITCYFDPETGLGEVKNTRFRQDLCIVEWDKDWHTFIIYGITEGAQFESGCLRDIADFLDLLKKEKKGKTPL